MRSVNGLFETASGDIEIILTSGTSELLETLTERIIVSRAGVITSRKAVDIRGSQVRKRADGSYVSLWKISHFDAPQWDEVFISTYDAAGTETQQQLVHTSQRPDPSPARPLRYTGSTQASRRRCGQSRT